MWGTRKGKNMDIKSLLETEIEEKHIQNFIYYSMIFIVLFVINFYVYFTYFRETFFEINILKSILLVISFSFPIYFLNVFSYYILEKMFIKIFKKERLEKENILKKIDYYNRKIDKLKKLVDNNKEVIKKYQLTHKDNFYIQHKRAEKKLLNMRNESLAFELNNINIKETFNDYKNKINNRFKRSISIGGLGYFVSVIIPLVFLPESFIKFLTYFTIFNSSVILIVISTILIMFLYLIFKKYKEKLSYKVSILYLILMFSPIILSFYIADYIQSSHEYIYQFFNKLF